MGTYGSIDFDDEEIEAASHWYGGQGSMLHAITSTGALSRGTIRPRHDDGTPMTDEEWIVDLAERLESEADRAASDAAKQVKKAKGDEKKALLADRDGLRSIAFKASQFVRDAERAKKQVGEKWLTTRHLPPTTSHATKKSPAQLDREIAEALSGRSPSSRHAYAGGRSHATIATRDYEYVVYPEASHRNAERAVKVPMRRVRGALKPYDLTEAKRVAKEMGPPAGIYSVSKGRFVGYVHPSGRYVPFR